MEVVMRKNYLLASVVVLLFCSLGVIAAPEKKLAAAKAPEHQMYSPADIKWTDAPPVLPAGAKAAVLEGDPAKPGYFALRLKLPDGDKIMPPWHPNVARPTVISG